MLLSLTLVLLLVSKAFSGSVSVSTASYPAGWCDLLQGTPTRTTGECICKKDCIGSGCQRAQGFIWFAYETCPTCKCTGVALVSNNGMKESKNIGSSSSSSDEKKQRPPIEEAAGGEGQRKVELPQQQQQQQSEKKVRSQEQKQDLEREEVEEPEMSWAEWVEERGRVIFAFVLCAVLLLLLLPALFLAVAPAPASTDTTSSAASPTSLKQGDGDSDVTGAGSGSTPSMDNVKESAAAVSVTGGAATRILIDAVIDANKKDE